MACGSILGAGHLGCRGKIFIAGEIRQLAISRVRKGHFTSAKAVLERSSRSEDGGGLNDAS